MVESHFDVNNPCDTAWTNQITAFGYVFSNFILFKSAQIHRIDTRTKFDRCHPSHPISVAAIDLNSFVGSLNCRNPSPNCRLMATEEPVVVTEVAAPEVGASVTVVVENEPAVEPAEGKPSKSKKTTTKRKPRTPSLHPPYFQMIKEAILALKEKSGSSQYAIAKFVEEKQKNLPANFKKVLLVQLKRLVADGKLVKVKASYKLPAAKLPAAAAKAKKKAVVKPKASAKPKPAAKKAPAKKKPAAKPRPAPKAKPIPKAKAVAKPKAAPKPKPVAKAKAAAPKAVAKPAVKAKPKAPTTKSAKVAKTSTRSTPRGKAAPASKPVKVAGTSTRSTPSKTSAAVTKPAAKKAVAAAKSVKAKAATSKKAAATRKGRK
ncbi:hypothetical protein L6452_06737 [Arctium lappa]|uniref:Uncharacterized protein n=1 Tax=Arctium lappa TaxID=4217 RepID=A0ACB9EKE4_ARCLA|nr:hypothetical protein L6452_06737 [Arctium lappa]